MQLVKSGTLDCVKCQLDGLIAHPFAQSLHPRLVSASKLVTYPRDLKVRLSGSAKEAEIFLIIDSRLSLTSRLKGEFFWSQFRYTLKPNESESKGTKGTIF